MTRKQEFRGVVRLSLLLALASATSCGGREDDAAPLSATADAELTQARERLSSLAALFPMLPTRGAGRVSSRRDGSLRVSFTEGQKGAARTATTELPERADGMATVTDDASGLQVRFALRGAGQVAGRSVDGVILYPGALPGGDLVHHTSVAGTEDYLVLTKALTTESLQYVVDVSQIAGLRLVGGSLEFLDWGGAPRLRVSPPYVVDATGERHTAHLRVEGCNWDDDPSPPWDRPVVRPGASSCTLHVSWGKIPYPVLVDPAWVATGSLASSRRAHGAVLLKTGRTLVLGGEHRPWSGSWILLSSAELYDEATGTFAATGGMKAERRTFATALLKSGKVLLMGGWLTTGGTASAEVYDPATGTFSPTGSMAGERLGMRAAVLNSGKVLIVGGGYKAIELYDESAGAFTQGVLATSASYPSANVLPSGKVLIAGGGGTPTATAMLYDPSTGFVTLTGSMLQARSEHAGVVLPSGKVLLAGGWSGTTGMTTAELYDSATGTFSATGPMAGARWDLPAVLLASGKVLVAAAHLSAKTNSSAELYDPAAGAFQQAPPMLNARIDHTLTLLDSGRVLAVAGMSGWSTSNSTVESAEIYDLTALGAACVANDDCGSGVCAGYCCATNCGPCTAGCAQGSGACIKVIDADDPDSCTGGKTCDTNGSCKLKVGQPCSSNAECNGGHCAQGVCCDSACAAPCEACSVAAGGAIDGVCSVSALGALAQSASCAGHLCDGASTACPVCLADTNCAATHYCSAGACMPRKAKGEPCADTKECTAGLFCADGVCCTSSCNTTCMACSASNKQSGADAGECGIAKKGTNPGSYCILDAAPCGSLPACSGTAAKCAVAPSGSSCGASTCSDAVTAEGALCDGAGACVQQSTVKCAPYGCGAGQCKGQCVTGGDCAPGHDCVSGSCLAEKANGTACTQASDCKSGICVDGVCCGSSCSGQCEACDAPGDVGKCVAISGSPHGTRAACAGTGACQGSCDGIARSQCAMPDSSVPCGDASCKSGALQSSGQCNGAGNCNRPPVTACGAYECDLSGTACRTECSTTADCASGNACRAGACTPSSSAGAPDDGGGCGCRVASRNQTGGVAGLLLVLALLARRRRRVFSLFRATRRTGRPTTMTRVASIRRSQRS